MEAKHLAEEEKKKKQYYGKKQKKAGGGKKQPEESMFPAYFGDVRRDFERMMDRVQHEFEDFWGTAYLSWGFCNFCMP